MWGRAGELGIDVVPLVQTIGHLEFVLVHERYAHLRERPNKYSQLCPSNPQSLELVKQMLSEVLELHPGLKYLHIGADETAHLGECPACAARVAQSDKLALYLDHVGKVCQWVEQRGLRPILWDDIVRRQPQRVERLPRSAVLMYWVYSSTHDVFSRDKHGVGDTYEMEYRKADRPADPDPLQVYRQAGYDVITAPCFTEGGLVPDVSKVAHNCRVMAEQAAQHGCLGVAATSWSCLFTPMSWAQHAAAVTLDAAWNPLPGNMEKYTSRRPVVDVEFDRRFCKQFLGLKDDTFIAALRLLENVYMYWPGGGIYPTIFNEPLFVDPSFLLDREGYAAVGAAIFRSDWPTAGKVPTWDKVEQAKMKQLRSCFSPSLAAAVVGDQLERSRRGLELLEQVAPQATRNQSFVEDMLVGAEARVWRTEHVLRQLTGKGQVPARPDIRQKLRNCYEKILSSEDAQTLVGYLLVGLP